MASGKKIVATTVAEMIKDLQANPSKRFSKSDFQALVYGVLSDKDFKAKKYMLKNDALQEETVCYHDGLVQFLDKVLKHAGMSNPDERAKVIDSFEFRPKDIEWLADAVDTAMSIYVENGKSMKMFRDQLVQLTLTKVVRSGKYAGKSGYKKAVLDRTALLGKKK